MRWSVLTMCFLLAGCAAPTGEADAWGQIDGAALDHLLQPYGNVTVHLVELDMEARTSERGGFSFFQVPPGYYTLRLDLGDAGRDQEVVGVRDAEITKVILQTDRHHDDDPYATLLQTGTRVDLAMPGERCSECEWQTRFGEYHPTSLDLDVSWPVTHPFNEEWQTHLIMRIETTRGDTLLGPLDRDDVTMDGDRGRFTATLMPVPEDLEAIRLRFTFDPDNEAPHPDFQLLSTMVLHHGDE